MSVDPIETTYLFNGHIVPGIWRYLLPKEVHQFRLPKERRATCDDCPQAKYEGYDKTYRCCSYHPSVPNFLLGLALGRKESRPAVKNLYRLGGLIPEGFSRTPHQWVDYLVDIGEDGFGEAKRVRCPNLNQENGYCNIYAFRNGVCSTFFCRNDHGTHGEKFWESVQELVSQMEFALSQWTLEQLGFDVKGYFKKVDKLTKKIETVADPKTRFWTEETRQYLWGDWFGRELEIFRECGQLVSKNRDRLWEITEHYDILESEKFDQAMNKMVPEEHQDEIDPDDLEPGENLSMKEIYQEVKRSYRRLWRVPEKLELSPRAKILKNPKDDKESKANSKRPYVLEFRSRRRGPGVEWREYLTQRQVDALKHFQRAKPVNDKLLKHSAFKGVSSPMNFLAENVGKKVLQKPPAR